MLSKLSIPSKEEALPGREQVYLPADVHPVLGSKVAERVSENNEIIYFGMGCFWGAERLFWQLDGVVRTAVGYGGGVTPNPSYEEVCSGRTGHTELVLVEYDPQKIELWQLLKVFWESHDPCQGMRQGNDVGTQYRSAIYCTTPEQAVSAKQSKAAFQQELINNGDKRLITAEIDSDIPFYFAESYHQQYLHKNPNGYCGIRGLGVCLVEKP